MCLKIKQILYIAYRFQPVESFQNKLFILDIDKNSLLTTDIVRGQKGIFRKASDPAHGVYITLCNVEQNSFVQICFVRMVYITLLNQCLQK